MSWKGLVVVLALVGSLQAAIVLSVSQASDHVSSAGGHTYSMHISKS